MEQNEILIQQQIDSKKKELQNRAASPSKAEKPKI